MHAGNYATLGDIVRPRGGADRDARALIFEGREQSYGELDARSSTLAQALIGRGIRRGDRVAVLSKSNLAYVELLFGIAKAGAVFVPLNWRLAAPELAFIVEDSEPALVFGERGLEALLSDAVRTNVQIVEFDDGADDLGRLLSDSIQHRHSREGGNPVLALSATGEELDSRLRGNDGLCGDDLAMLIYTSGTTGRPKGVMITHSNFRRHCDLDGAQIPAWMGIARDEVCLNVLPLFHVGGLEMLLRPLFTGATVILHREFDLARIIHDIGRYRVTMTGLVPTAIGMLLDHPQSASADFSSLRKFLYGAAPIPLDLLKRGLDRMGCAFVQTYGMTEVNSVCVMLSPEDHHDREAPRLRSAGKPTFDTELRIVDAEGRELATGEIGEITVRSGSVMKGYWRRPEATAEVLDANGWLRSGDAGYLDADGFVYVCDRVKDMICSGGENIYPAEVESAIYGHPTVAEVAVVGVPHARWGESVHAVVVPKPGTTVVAADIIAFAGERIARYKLPRTVESVSALPKNATGKVLRREVRARVHAALQLRGDQIDEDA